jgi:hypothetical protein
VRVHRFEARLYGICRGLEPGRSRHSIKGILSAFGSYDSPMTDFGFTDVGVTASSSFRIETGNQIRRTRPGGFAVALARGN